MKPVLLSMAALLLGLNAAPDSVHAQVRPADRWVWSLYESGGSVVLANEVPDTTQLRATLECTPGEGMAVLSLYDPQAGPGFARVTAGTAASAVEVRAASSRRIAG